MRLSEAQVRIIKKLVEESGIERELLRDDVVDHLCCVVEMKLLDGLNFNEALSDAVSELSPGGLNLLEKQTTFLLNSNKIKIMRTVTYSVGLLSLMTVCTGLILRLFHLGTSANIISFGLLIFGFVFLPIAGINYLKHRVNRAFSERVRVILGVLCGIFLSTGVTFKVLNLFGANEILILGLVILGFGFLPFFFFTVYNKTTI